VALSGSAKELPEIENTQAQAINRDCMVFMLASLDSSLMSLSSDQSKIPFD
jgi:hypothetical protein